MLFPLRDRSFWLILTLLGILSACLICLVSPVAATIHDWDNWTGDGQFSTVNNWLPVAGAPPGVGDTALFDGQLSNLGIGDNTVNVPDGTAINDMQVFNSTGFPATVFDMTIGDGTTSSRFDLDDTTGDSLLVGKNPGDTATLNLIGGWLDTYDVSVGGRAALGLDGVGAYWDAANVTISGDTSTTTAQVNILGRSETTTRGDLNIGSDTGSGRAVVHTSGVGVVPSLWYVTGNVDVGPTVSSGFNFGEMYVQSAGKMLVVDNVDVHGTTNIDSKVIVRTGGDLEVLNLLSIGTDGVLELSDSTSTITTGDIDNDGGTLDWTGGTLHITEGLLRIDDSTVADLEMDQLTVDSGMTLKVSTSIPDDAFRVGDTGAGTMTIQNGGVVESFHGVIGQTTGGDGTVNVTGGTSRWILTEDLRVGAFGSSVGRLNITAGQVSANSIFLGALGSADGTVTVDGGTLTSSAVLAVGGIIGDDGASNAIAGGTGQLTVKNGGTVDVEKTLIVFGGAVNLTSSGGQIMADTIRLEPGATFADAPGTVVTTNALVGFGNNASFAGNLQIGHSGGSGTGSHTVGLVHTYQTLTVGANLTVGVDVQGSLATHNGNGTVNSYNSFIGGGAGSGGSWVDVNGLGSYWNANQIHVGGNGMAPQAQAALTISDAAAVIVSDRIKVWGPGSLILDGGLISADLVEVEGELLGTGSIFLNPGPTVVVTNRGLIAPGLEELGLYINGLSATDDAYVQEASGRLAIEIGGTLPTKYGHLDISPGSAALDGYLEVRLIDPLGGSNIFVPKGGDKFEILTADDGLGGTRFDTQPGDLPALTGELFWEILYGSTFVRLDVLSPFSADFDRDGDVDNDDRTLWEGDYGINGDSDADGDGDGDGDGDSDGGDYLIWQRQFGSGVPVVVNNSVVPEPASMTLVILATLGLGFITQNEKRKSRITRINKWESDLIGMLL